MRGKDYYGQYPQIPRIQWLHLHNFKSFKGDHHIGPFLNFTSIIGPNGSGKSNLLDALCFVLLIRISQSREISIKQLISKSQIATRMWVEINFCDREGKELVFKRLASIKGQYGYYFNGKIIAREEYIQELKNCEVIKQTRSYCAIMQGEIDYVLQNSSREIVRIMEELSGSSEYKERYEELKKNMDQTQNQITSTSKMIQELRRERRKAKGLKTNIEAYERSRELLSQLQQEYYVGICALYELKAKEFIRTSKDLQEKIKLQSDVKDADIEKLRELGNEIIEIEEEALEREREKERLRISRAQHEKTIRVLDLKVEALRKDKQSKEMVLVALEKAAKKDKEKIKEIEAEKIQLNEEYERFMEEMKEVEEKSQIGHSQQDEYYKIKSEVVAKTFDVQSELKRLTGYIEGYTQRILALNEIIGKLRVQIKTLESEKEQIDLKKLESEINNKKEEQKECAEKYMRSIEMQKERYTTIANLEMHLTTGEYELRRLEQEQEFKVLRGREYHMIEQLKTKVRGCHGLLIQLITACEKKYDVAVKFGLGKYLTHLVVDDESAAISCNIFLKDAGVMKEILILSNIPRSAYVTPSTTTISPNDCAPGSVRLIDTIEYNANIKRLKEAILFIAGKKIVCENLQSARALRTEGFKEIITLNGEILKQGIISGGRNDALLGLELQHSKQVGRIDQIRKEVEHIKQQLNNLKKQSSAVEMIESKSKLDAVGSLIAELEGKLMNEKERMHLIEKSLEETSSRLKNAEKEKEELEVTIEKSKEEIKELKAEVNSIEETMFKDFCTKWNISDVKKYEGTDLLESNTLLAKKSMLLQRIGQCNTQLELLKAEKISGKIKKLKEDIDNTERSLNDLIGNLSNEKNKSKEIEDSYNNLNNEYVKAESKRADCMNRQKELAEEVSRSNEAIDELKKELISSVCQIKTNANMKIRTIDEAKLKAIPIQIEAITNPEKMLVQGMSIDYRIDYNKYDIDTLIITSKDMELKIKELVERISDEEKLLNDFNALALMKEEGEDLQDIDKEMEVHRKHLDKLSKEHEGLEKEYKRVKEARQRVFKHCYDLISTYIDGIYQELTKVEETGFAYGGHAILVPENVGEPYNGEIQYVPTPPGKRVVYELEQLSGGEKALAALALILAIQKYQQSAILLLDEVDAHLDAKNVIRLGNILANRAKESGFQCIMVSHKESLAVLSHGVIGVTQSKSTTSSKTLSLDLRQ